MYYFATYTSPIGVLTLACDPGGKHLVGLWNEGQKHYGASIPEAMEENDCMPVFDTAKQWLDQYFAGKNPSLSALPMAPIGSAFRREIWQILCEIPYGQVMTYLTISKQIAKKRGKESMSSQAVGGAIAHNPISIMIPCHRVVGSNGSLTGYAGGIQKKIKLLELEGVDLSPFFVPKKGTAL